MGQSVTLDMRKDKADIIRLSFGVNPHHEDLLLGRKDVSSRSHRRVLFWPPSGAFMPNPTESDKTDLKLIP